jgi:hypothetical protein
MKMRWAQLFPRGIIGQTAPSSSAMRRVHTTRLPKGVFRSWHEYIGAALTAIIAVGLLTYLPLATAQPVKSDYASYSPVFAQTAKTLDPMDVARTAWMGYVENKGDPWGILPDGTPALRLCFDCRALPWSNIKHGPWDGPCDNLRSVGAFGLLYAMFGDEKKEDAVERGQIGYLKGCSDPDTGLAYFSDSLPRNCFGGGDQARNVLVLYEQTRRKDLRDWAAKMLKAMRYYATVREVAGVGTVAEYNQGDLGGEGGFPAGEPPVKEAKDPTLGGWQYLHTRWNVEAFSRWYSLTGDRSSLDFAVALANRICNGDPDGNDGSFRPDGSFGGKSQACSGSWHMHGHTHCLPALMHLGGQLMKSEQKEKGLQFIKQVRSTFDWLYDPARNPDAGSMTGWVGEWLMTATGWPRKTDCEGCTMGDMVQTACSLGAASRLDPGLAGYVSYYDRAEQIFRGELVEQMFRLTPDYLKVLRQELTKRVAKDLAQASDEAKSQEVEKRYKEAVATAGRMVGQQLGLSGFPDWVNHTPSDLDSELPGIHMQGCCADATIRAAHAIWSETVTGGSNEARVNMAFNRNSPLVNVKSCLPHRGEMDVFVGSARRVLVRLPEWAPKESVRAYVQKQPVPVKWEGSYVVFDKVSKGQQLTITYPLSRKYAVETSFWV